jgi:hypothetical protein
LRLDAGIDRELKLVALGGPRLRPEVSLVVVWPGPEEQRNARCPSFCAN